MKGFKILLLFTLLISVGCEDFVNTIPKGRVIPETVEHCLQLIDRIQPSLSFMELSSPDTWLPDIDAFYSFDKMGTDITNRYIWEDANTIYNIGEGDVNYNIMYGSIYALNVVIERIMDASGNSEYSKEEIMAMAKVHRATAYHALVQIYGKQYDPTTAGVDLGVPLRLNPNIDEKIPRATVKENYDFIVSELKSAAEALDSEIGELANRPSKGAAYAILARVYLFMGNYDEAYKYSNLTIETVNGQREVLDYHTLQPVSPWDSRKGITGYSDKFLSTAHNTEIIYARNNEERWTLMSEELSALMPAWKESGENRTPYDFRKIFMVEPLKSNLKGWYAGVARHHHLGVDVSEVYLMRAESNLRMSTPNINEALTDLNDLIKKRIYSVYHSESLVDETDPSALLDLVLLERRRENYMSYMSFFDMKRLNSGPLGKGAKAKNFTRRVKGKVHTMTKNSDHYTYLIPFNVVSEGNYIQNPGWNR